MALSSATKKSIGILLGVTIIFLIGFFVGRKSFTPQIITEYIKGDTIHDSIPIPPPISEVVPENPKYLTKWDTLYLTKDSIIYVKESIDTLAILADWIKKRTYDIQLFDTDTLGTLNIHANVQYNRLGELTYDYVPVYRRVTIQKEPLFTPFIMGGINSHWRPELEVGTFIKNFGISGSISHDSEKMIYSIKVGYKFK